MFLTTLQKFKLYTWLYKWSRKKYRETYLDIFKADSKCGNCDQWNSIISIDHDHFTLETSFGYMRRCGLCKRTTHWNTGLSMLPVICDPNGNPIRHK